jgi:sarcosine oxidase
MNPEVAVVGLGSMGSFAFWQLAKMGVKVIGFEKFIPGHDKGEAHGESRIFRTSYAEGAEYVPLLFEARKLWRDLENDSGEELYLETGGLMVGRPNDGFLDGILKCVQLHDIPHEIFTSREAQKLFPQHIFEDQDVVLLDKQAGLVKPELAIKTAIEQGLKHGGIIYAENEVTTIEPDESGVTITCGDKAFRVRHVIVAAGAWTSKLFPQLQLPVWVERQVMFWYEMKTPRLFMPDQFGIFARVINGHNWYGFPSLNGKTVKIAIHHEGETVDPDTIDRNLYLGDMQPVTELVKQYIPDLIPEPVKGKVCMYTNTADNYFILGQMPSIPNLTFLGPMAGHGFKFAPIIGKIGAEMSMGYKLSHSIDIFNPNRFLVPN